MGFAGAGLRVAAADAAGLRVRVGATGLRVAFAGVAGLRAGFAVAGLRALLDAAGLRVALAGAAGLRAGFAAADLPVALLGVRALLGAAGFAFVAVRGFACAGALTFARVGLAARRGVVVLVVLLSDTFGLRAMEPSCRSKQN